MTAELTSIHLCEKQDLFLFFAMVLVGVTFFVGFVVSTFRVAAQRCLGHWKSHFLTEVSDFMQNMASSSLQLCHLFYNITRCNGRKFTVIAYCHVGCDTIHFIIICDSQRIR